MQSASDTPVPYRRSLRALGAWLDEEPHARFEIIETQTGFTVILDGTGEEPARQEHTFTYEDLAQRDAELEVERGHKDDIEEPDVYVGHWSLAPTTHQDFFRAVGNELDDTKAAQIALDELEDSVALSFSYLDQSGSYVWHKRMVVLTPSHAEQVLAVARSRRQKSGTRKFLDYITRMF